MSTSLKDKYTINWLGYPPRMSPEDYELWKKYHPRTMSEGLFVYYDVGLGGRTDWPPGTSPDMQKMWFENTQKRIDVLIETLEHWIIIELRHNAQSSAIGRLKQYKLLWEEDPIDKRPVILRLVTNRYDQDLEKLSKKEGIEYIVINDYNSSL